MVHKIDSDNMRRTIRKHVLLSYKCSGRHLRYMALWRSLCTELFTGLPRYLSDRLSCVADMPVTSRLGSTFNQLTVRPSRLVTVGKRSFASAGPVLWNSLPDDITSASSVMVFKRKLKTHLFRQSYRDIIM